MIIGSIFKIITLDTLNRLKAEFDRQPEKIIIPTYNGKKGHPPIFSVYFKEQFLDLKHYQGINSVYQKLTNEIILYPVNDPGVIKTFNTPEEFATIITE